MPLLLPHIDIKSLIERYAPITLAGDAIVRGVREYHSNCPWCGGTDRFIMRPETGWYTCTTRASGCGRRGDMQDFLKEYAGLSFQEICEVLEIDPATMAGSGPVAGLAPLAERPPSKIWQEAATVFVERAERYLWHPNAPKAVQALAYLRKRGLSDETIKRARLGYCPLLSDGRWYQDSFEHWGIDPEQLREDQREKGGVRIPDGIVIPWTEGSTVWKLAIKRPGQIPDYGQVSGSGEGLYNVNSVQYDQPAMLVEGEFDCLSVQQVAGDLVNVVATGSTTRGRLARWVGDLSFASVVLQSFDSDQAGEEGAHFWQKTLSSCIRWAPEGAKDPNDMLQQYGAGFLRDWVQTGLDAWQVTQEPPLPEPSQPAPPRQEPPVPPPAPEPVEAGQQMSTEDERLSTLARLVAEAVRVFDLQEMTIERRQPRSLTMSRKPLHPPARKTFLDYR